MPTPVPVTVLGATGTVGQRFVERLAQHPWFRIERLAASGRSAGKRYRDATAWRLPSEAWGGLGDEVLVAAEPGKTVSPVVFSALDADVAAELEPAYARAGALVFSNASAFRMEADVPLLVPEVNPDHLDLLSAQRKLRGWSGGIVCNANCTATVLVMALAPLHKRFGVEAVMMASMQAISGAGYPGVASLDITANVIPYIAKEEEKVEEEVPKMLGILDGSRIAPAAMAVSASCHRVAVVEGHTEAVAVQLRGTPSLDLVRAAWLTWSPEPQRLKLPSAPLVPVRIHDVADRPQPRLDVERDGGMSVHVGRLRACAILGVKFALLGHNTQRGAAGGSVLNAELAHARGLIA